MTPEQAAKFMDLADGDTDALTLETGSSPAATTDAVVDDPEAGKTDIQEAAKPVVTTAAAPTEAELNAENAVIQAKDGKHTISYDKLVEAREGEKTARTLLAAQTAELEGLRAAAQVRADAGLAPTKADNLSAAAEAAIEAGADTELFGDFSEQALAKGIKELVRQQATEIATGIVDQRFQTEMAPIKADREKQADDAHNDAIYAKHPDADSIVESKEFGDWFNAQPAYAKPGIAATFDKGTSAQVVEVFDRFKHETGATPTPVPDANSVKGAAQAAIAKAQAAPPASLSDIPGGKAAATSREEQLAGMDGLELTTAMADMTEAQLEHYLNRL